MKAGEHALLPSVREAGAGTLGVANGFSCKTQVEHGASRCALHLAEVLKLARDGELAKQPAPSGARRARRAAALAAAGRPTLELVLVESPAHPRKEHDPETGLALIAPRA